MAQIPSVGNSTEAVNPMELCQAAAVQCNLTGFQGSDKGRDFSFPLLVALHIYHPVEKGKGIC